MRGSPLLIWTVAAPFVWGSCDRARPATAPPPPASAVQHSADASPPPYVTPPPLDVFAPPADAERDPSGAVRKILARGKGTRHPSVGGSYVELRYSGWERNGHQFEGSASNGEPVRYDLHELVDGLRREITLMVEGDKRRLWLPADLAYGKRTNFANAPKGDLTYEVELVRIVPVPPVPPDVAAPPKEATTTKSGLAYVVLDKGKGKKHPTETSHAFVSYCGWTPDGRMFQTSLLGGDSARVLVKLLPEGWREAMLKMVEGDRWRLWLPGKLAFGELRPGEEALPFGPPPGPVVYEVRLLQILDK